MIHPKFDKYEFDAETGCYRRVGSEAWKAGAANKRGYMQCCLSSTADKKQKTLSVHRALWEACKGPIPDKYEIFHKDGNVANNKLDNLECVSREESSQKRNHDFLEAVREKRASKGTQWIRAVDLLNPGEDQIFPSKYKAGKACDCSPAMVHLICEGKNKTSKGRYTFSYV